MTEAVRVMVRCRPMSIKEKDRGCKNVVEIDSSINQVRIIKEDAKDPPKTFSFDYVFGPDVAQSFIYEQTAFSLVDNVLQGYNGTIFAYGQTGCGKTHTMMGSSENEDARGIIPRTFHQIVTLTGMQAEKKHLVQCSFIEIYNQEIHDLLGKDIKARMQLKESPDKGVFVKDLSMNLVKTVEEMEKFMEIGFKNRAVRETAMNKESSRSHSIFTIHIESSEVDQLGNQKFKVGKLNLVDLAGSERQSKTNATGDGMKEAAKINLSLSALGNVISALVDGKIQHIPYRDSKLTRLLQDSLGGNTKTIMIAAVSPADYNFEETLSTLRYASRAKFIQNKPKINEDPKDALLRQYADEIKALKMMLEGKMPMDSSAFLKLQNGENMNRTETVYREVIVQRESNNSQLENQLKSKEDLLKNEQEEKEKLKIQLENLQKIVGKNDNPIDKKQIEKIQKLKQKVKAQKKKEEEYKALKKKRDEELMSMEKNYKSLNEEVQQMRKKYQQIKVKYIENLTEIKDAQIEHQNQKEQLLDAIRYQQKQLGKYSSILKMILTADQIQQIVSQSEYNDQTKEWIIVPFYYRQKSVNFPKLQGNHNRDLIQSQKDKKQIVFREMNKMNINNTFISDSNNANNILSAKNNAMPLKGNKDYRISNVVREARQSNQFHYKDKQRSTIDINAHEIKSSAEINHLKMKSTKNHLQPLNTESQQRIRYEQPPPNLKIKLNPINSKKQVNRQSTDGISRKNVIANYQY